MYSFHDHNLRSSESRDTYIINLAPCIRLTFYKGEKRAQILNEGFYDSLLHDCLLITVSCFFFPV